MEYEYFSRRELSCKCGCGLSDMDEDFMRRLESLRQLMDRAMPVTSGYRCPRHNKEVSGTGTVGPHTTGRAVDIRIHGQDALRLVSLAVECGFTGIGIKQHGPLSGRFVHLDDLTMDAGRPRPWIWTYP